TQASLRYPQDQRQTQGDDKKNYLANRTGWLLLYFHYHPKPNSRLMANCQSRPSYVHDVTIPTPNRIFLFFGAGRWDRPLYLYYIPWHARMCLLCEASG